MNFKALRAALIGLACIWTAVGMAQDRPVIMAQNHPLAYFAERLAGGAAEVAVPSPADVDPADWTPGVEEIAQLQEADLILLNGRAYADWVAKASLPRARLVDTTAGFRDALIAEEAAVHRHGPKGEHSHSGVALHTWLDFGLAAQQAQAVAKGVMRKTGADAGAVEKALEALTGDLNALDAQAHDATAKMGGVLVVGSHPIYQYFARAYGVEMRSVHWEYDEPVSPAQWAELDEILASHPRLVFLWEGPPTEGAREGLKARGVVSTMFDPAYIRREGDFLQIMQANLKRLEQAAAQVAAP